MGWLGTIRFHGRTSPNELTIQDFTVEPKQSDWRRFWQALDGLDVWMWRQRYEPAVLSTDGYMWSVRISAVGRICDSSGYKAVRSSSDESGRSATWDVFLLAVSDLLGGVAVV